jgi:hypothetical protein
MLYLSDCFDLYNSFYNILISLNLPTLENCHNWEKIKPGLWTIYIKNMLLAPGKEKKEK